MQKITKQIFFDRAQVRWRYSRTVIIAAGAFFAVLFCVAIGSIIIRPVLPQIGLAQPVSKYRGAANVSSAPNQVVPNQQSPVFNAAFAPQNFSGNSSNADRKMIGFYVNWDDNSFTSLKANVSHLDELMPEWYHLSASSPKVVVDDQGKQNQATELIKQIKPSLQISPLINNFSQEKQDWDPDALSAMLSSADSRSALIANLQKTVQQNNFAGISIDFESVPDAQQQNLILFMKQLWETFHPLGLEVSQNVPLDDNSFDLKTLSQYSDFLILMAYDEHSIYDSPAGPVASQGWFSAALAKQIKLVGAEKLVVAVGGYGYDWVDKKQSGDEVSFQDAVRIAKESEGVIGIDKKSLNPTFDYYDDNNVLHHVWYLDATSTFNEMLVANQLGNVKGFALWRIGSEDPSTWDIFDRKSSLNEQTAKKLESMQYGYDVSYEGDGEILQVTSTPKVGKRNIFWDPKSGLIMDETVSEFPSSYEITRWGGGDKKKLAITFDDGPDQKYTPKILDILKKYNVPATFFIIGTNANSNQDLLKRIVSDGSEIGNHTYTHPNISSIGNQQFRVELDATERLLEGVLGRKSLLFRPPYSEDIEPNTPDQVLPLLETKNLGYYTIGMHIDPMDWNKPGTDQIISSVVQSAQNGDGNIILLHDSGGNRDQTVAALPKIIEQLQAQGFSFVTVSSLMGLSPGAVMPKVSAREQFVARINGAAFTTISVFNNFIYIMFLLGIFLGLIRFLFIGTLAVAQYVHSRHGKFQKYCLDCNFLVDVIIPAYNEEKVILRTIGAILNSTYKNFQVIVVDDGSTDDTYQKVLEAYGKNPQVTIYSKANGGKSDALNYGIERSIGEIVITLDADTLFKHDTIEKIVRRFVDRRIAAVAGNAKVGNRINILTRWQALEYITSQNFDRRAFELLNCISVVPGAVGAWRRSALVEAGGFSNDTLAEDADLTFSILRRGHMVAYDDQAIGLTEAPESVKNFLAQRFRWMYGTLQTAWKHKDVLFRPQYKGLGFFAIPNTAIFQIFFPLISPLMDLMLIFSIIWTFIQRQSHQVDFSSTQSFRQILIYYFLFTLIDLLTASIPFLLEHKEDWKLLLWMPLQRFFYRQLIYYVAIKSLFTALIGQIVGWGKFERSADVGEPLEESIES
jgi:cellulose synthase/poly-beta-1,6-N-acetylglucosamine synthase-like glycosyltransferase/peptidoglycan/xylan/chitin deacetylase (PgdA/CDA1 family)/spore germination protein YaaH